MSHLEEWGRYYSSRCEHTYLAITIATWIMQLIPDSMYNGHII